jgi:hypothetical protein
LRLRTQASHFTYRRHSFLRWKKKPNTFRSGKVMKKLKLAILAKILLWISFSYNENSLQTT